MPPALGGLIMVPDLFLILLACFPPAGLTSPGRCGDPGKDRDPQVVNQRAGWEVLLIYETTQASFFCVGNTRFGVDKINKNKLWSRWDPSVRRGLSTRPAGGADASSSVGFALFYALVQTFRPRVNFPQRGRTFGWRRDLRDDEREQGLAVASLTSR